MKNVKRIELVKKSVIVFSFIYLINLMVSALRWRIDPHHDGIMFLPAILGKNNHLPQESLFYFYGIAQPFLEGMIFKVIPVYMISYRFIAFLLILITGYFLYKIISLKLSKSISVMFSLIWLFANPTWANSFKSIPVSIQIPWPNLWMQTIFIICIYIILRYQLTTLHTLTLVSVMGTSLPFFRTQGVIYSVCIVLLVLIVDKTKIFLYLILSIAVILAWLLLIQTNGGLSLYFTNTIAYPREFYRVFTTFDYFFNFFAHSMIYYLVCGIILLSYLCIVNFSYFKTTFQVKFSFIISLLLLLCILINFEFDQWTKIISDNSSSILLDSFILLAVTHTVIMLLSYCRANSESTKQRNRFLDFYGLASLSNLIFQYPLPDLGHRWWSSAILVLFFAEVYSLDLNHIFKINKNITRKALIFCGVGSIIVSGIQGLKFLNFERKDLKLSTSHFYRGIQFPVGEQQMIEKFNSSLNVLNYLENLNIEIKYVCRDGLYYIRNSGYVAQARDFLYSSGNEREILQYVNDSSDRVTFYCNTDSRNIKNLSQFKFLTIGQNNTDHFVFNDTLLYVQLKSYIDSTN